MHKDLLVVNSIRLDIDICRFGRKWRKDASLFHKTTPKEGFFSIFDISVHYFQYSFPIDARETVQLVEKLTVSRNFASAMANLQKTNIV